MTREFKAYDPDYTDRWSVAFLAFIDHPTDPVYLWTGYGVLEFDPGIGEQTWLGCHGLSSIKLPQSTGEISVSNVELTLSGVDPGIAEAVVEQVIRGSTCKVWRVLLNDERKVVDSEELLDTVQDFARFTLTDSGSAEITLVCLDRFGYLSQQSVRTLTPEYLKIITEENGVTGGVTGADRVHELQTQNISWRPA